MSFTHIDLLAVIKERPLMTTSQIADAVGESDIRLVSRELGNLNKADKVVKNGQKLWAVVTDVRGEYVDKYDISQLPKTKVTPMPSVNTVVKSCVDIPAEIELELKNLEKVISRPDLPKALAELCGIDIELAVLERFIGQFHPEIAVVLERTHDRLLELKAFSKAKAA